MFVLAVPSLSHRYQKHRLLENGKYIAITIRSQIVDLLLFIINYFRYLLTIRCYLPQLSDLKGRYLEQPKMYACTYRDAKLKNYRICHNQNRNNSWEPYFIVVLTWVVIIFVNILPRAVASNICPEQ